MNTKKLVLAALTVTLLGSGAAFAGSGNNGNGRGAADNERNTNGNGAIASELKWRNAAHASEQAFLNASPNSAVGKLAALRDARDEAAYAYVEAGVDQTDPLRDPEVIRDAINDILSIYPNELAAVQTAQGNFDTAVLAGATDVEIEALKALVTDAQTSLDTAIALAGDDVELAELKAELALPEVQEVKEETIAEAVVGIGIGEGELSAEAVEALWDLLDK